MKTHGKVALWHHADTLNTIDFDRKCSVLDFILF